MSFSVVILYLIVASIGSCRTGLIYLFSYIYADPTGFNDVNLYLIVANVCCFVYRSVAHRLILYSGEIPPVKERKRERKMSADSCI